MTVGEQRQESIRANRAAYVEQLTAQADRLLDLLRDPNKTREIDGRPITADRRASLIDDVEGRNFTDAVVFDLMGLNI